MENNVYSGSLGREKFLYYENKIVAKLLLEGLSEDEIITKVFEENLFQYPSLKMIKNLTRVVLKRLQYIKDNKVLLKGIVEGEESDSKFIILYTIMKENRLVREYFMEIIGKKYKYQDNFIDRIDINEFIDYLNHQSTHFNEFQESTKKRMLSELIRITKDMGYIDSTKLGTLNNVYINQYIIDEIESMYDSKYLMIIKRW